MSPLPWAPEVPGERPWWLADDPVLVGPVSGWGFPASRENNRKFRRFRAFSANCAIGEPAKSTGWRQNSLRRRAANFLAGAGNSSDVSGNFLASAGLAILRPEQRTEPSELTSIVPCNGGLGGLRKRRRPQVLREFRRCVGHEVKELGALQGFSRPSVARTGAGCASQPSSKTSQSGTS
jgi:hypothetical protein